MYHIFWSVFVVSSCPIASSHVKMPSVYCFIDLHWKKRGLISELLNEERRKKKNKWTCFCVVFTLRAAVCSHVLLDKIIKQPACSLLNTFYTHEYYNPLGCLLILFTPTLRSTNPPQWHFCCVHLWSGCKGWEPGVPQNKTQNITQRVRHSFHPPLTERCRALQAGSVLVGKHVDLSVWKGLWFCEKLKSCFRRVRLKTGCQEYRPKFVEYQFNLFHLQSLFMLHLLWSAPLNRYLFNSFCSSRTLIDTFEKVTLKIHLESCRTRQIIAATFGGR